MKKILSMITAFSMIIILFATDASASSQIPFDADTPIIQEKNQQIYSNNFTNLDKKVNDLKKLEEGTIIVRFRYNSGDIMSLFSLSNSDLPNGHFNMYISPNSVGMENRYQGPDQPSSNTHIKANVHLKENEVHTVAMVVDKNEGYKIFLNGEQVLHDTKTERKFLNNIHAPNSAQLGRTVRSGNSNNYLFNGVIDFAEVYGKPLADQDLIEITGVTSTEIPKNPLPDDALITEPYSVFSPGLYGSNAYRIPALFNTMDGTLLAGIDKRINHSGDSPANIDIMVRRSLDNGKTWENDGILINDYPGDASNIDQSLLQDQDTKRIYSLVLGFPEGGGFPTAQKGTGFKSIDGNQYMVLHDNANNEYTIREDGEIFDSANERTDYSVDEKRNLYLKGSKISNILLNQSPLKPLKTSYLELWHSDDEGSTWSGPIDLNPTVKEEWMAFLGGGPGSGIQLKHGPNKGRLVFPIYFTNENRAQASAVIYSDDHGVTWKRGESPNEGRIVDGKTLSERTFSGSHNELTEAQVVELPDGQLKLFMRNYSGYARIATSFDGGETWDSEVVIEQDLVAPYSQMTAIKYNGLIDGKEAVIFASAGHSSSRINGTVKIGLINEDGTYSNGRTKYKFDWKYSQLVKEGAYGYSSLANLSDGSIGLFYENGTSMDFIKFNEAFLKWDHVSEVPVPSIKSMDMETNDEDGYSFEDSIRVKVVFDHYVMLSGDRSLTAKIGDQDVRFTLMDENREGTEFVFEAKFPKLDAGVYELNAKFSKDLSIYNAFGQELDKSADVNQLVKTVRAKDEQKEANISELKAMVEHFEEKGEFNSKKAAQSLNTHLTAVGVYEEKKASAKVVKHMEGFKLLLDQQKQNELISENAYNKLKDGANSLITKWQ